jgi:hypothetical protein
MFQFYFLDDGLLYSTYNICRVFIVYIMFDSLSSRTTSFSIENIFFALIRFNYVLRRDL